MTYGVKFCGGCNPRYDRKAALGRIEAYFHGKISFVNAKEGVLYDGLLVLGGCQNCCASFSQLDTKRPPVLMWDAEQEDQVRTIIGF